MNLPPGPPRDPKVWRAEFFRKRRNVSAERIHEIGSMIRTMPKHDYPAIMEAILADYALPVRGHHGVVHWARVMENGLRIAEINGADVEVVKLFAIFHDARRVNERIDQGHGQRGGDFARTLRGSLVHLDDARFDLLYEACRLHTEGQTEADPTIQACWDADRLDLGRVGITPHKRFLCTEAARGMVYWAHNRAVTRHEPAAVLASWGVKQKLEGVTSSPSHPW